MSGSSARAQPCPEYREVYKIYKTSLGTSRYGIICNLWMNDRKIFLENNNQLTAYQSPIAFAPCCQDIRWLWRQADSKTLNPSSAVLYAINLRDRGDQKESRSFLRFTSKHRPTICAIGNPTIPQSHHLSLPSSRLLGVDNPSYWHLQYMRPLWRTYCLSKSKRFVAI